MSSFGMLCSPSLTCWYFLVIDHILEAGHCSGFIMLARLSSLHWPTYLRSLYCTVKTGLQSSRSIFKHIFSQTFPCYHPVSCSTMALVFLSTCLSKSNKSQLQIESQGVSWTDPAMESFKTNTWWKPNRNINSQMLYREYFCSKLHVRKK